jgi:hypothetical protein
MTCRIYKALRMTGPVEKDFSKRMALGNLRKYWIPNAILVNLIP